MATAPTFSRRLGWHPGVGDSRHLKFLASPRVLASLPASFDLDTPSIGAPFDPAWDQGNLGSCGPNTASEMIVYDQTKDPGEVTAPVVMPSRLFVYYVTRDLMGTIRSDSGVDNATMLKAMAQYGYCDESLWPYTISKFTDQPPTTCFAEAATRKQGFVYQSVAQNLAVMKACLVQTGRPFMFGFTVYDSMMTPAVDASGIVPDPTSADSVDGGHDVTFVGYDDNRQIPGSASVGAFRFKNHWTPQWGLNGYGWISYAYATNPQLASDFWTITKASEITVSPAPVPPGPTPGPTPTPTPPAPPKPSPGTLQQQVDTVFAEVEQALAGRPIMLRILMEAQTVVDAWFAAHPSSHIAGLEATMSTEALQAIIDGIFAALEMASVNPMARLALQIAQQLVDQYLFTIPTFAL
jgi:hypothetical protein